LLEQSGLSFQRAWSSGNGGQGLSDDAVVMADGRDQRDHVKSEDEHRLKVNGNGVDRCAQERNESREVMAIQ
jgi:hypothetical protein